MGNPKQKWTAEEEDALRRGIDKYGPGKWKFIQRDPEFNKHLYSRSNIDLKDKWRNMSAAAGQGPREKSRAPKPKNPDSTVAPNVSCLTATPVVPVAQDLHADLVKDDLSKDPKNGPRYNAMVMEALSTTKERYGLDITSLMSYIEQRVEEVPQNFRKLLGSRLRRLVAREELEKIENCYRIKPAVVKDPHPKRAELISHVKMVVQTLVKGEEMSFKVAEAASEAEKIAKLAEEADNILQLANEIYESCSRGETVRIA